MGKIFYSFLKKEDGVAATEFALIAPILIYILMGIVDYGLFINQRMVLEDVARTSAEYMVKGGDANLITADVIEQSSLLPELGNITVITTEECECADGISVSCTIGSCNADDYMRNFYAVSLEMPYATKFPYPGIPNTINLQGHARLRIQ